jgi:hypothetical protein
LGGVHVDPQAIKHEAQAETQHPLFEPLINQWEELTQHLQYQPQRQAFVQSHTGRIARIWTDVVRSEGCADEALEAFRLTSLEQHGVPATQVLREIEARASRGATPGHSVTFYEYTR